MEWDSVPGNTKLDPFRHVSVAMGYTQARQLWKVVKEVQQNKGKHLRGFYNALVDQFI